MLLPRMLNSIYASMHEQYVADLLESNEIAKQYGLLLTPGEIKEMMAVRNEALRAYGRVELGIEPTKRMMETFCASPYINAENYASVLNELHEIFYDLKNETEDRVGDDRLIGWMKNCFDNECGGSLELLKSKLESMAEQVRRGGEREELEDMLERGELS